MPFPYFADCWFLTGPTAAVKARSGIGLALRLGGEIVSLDSMALYRGIDIGTAKPTLGRAGRVPHHLIDISRAERVFSLAQYPDAAERCRQKLLARAGAGVRGGNAAVPEGIVAWHFPGAAADWEFRQRTTSEAQRPRRRVAPRACWPRSIRRRPQRLHPQDTKRLMRALEVYEKTGRPISELQQQFDRARPAGECRVFVLDWPRETLYQRIEAASKRCSRLAWSKRCAGCLATPADELSR